MGQRLFRAFLYLLPAEVRDGYARELEITIRSERRSAARLWLSAIGDVMRIAPAWHWDILKRDLRYAWRVLAARPMHLVGAAGTLALGLGASIAMFAVIDAVLWKPWSFADPARIVRVGETSEGGKPGPMGYLTFTDVRAQSQTLESISGATRSTATLTGSGRDAERVNVMRTSATYFDLIGVRPAIGRAFTASEDQPGAARRVTILSNAVFQRRFGGDARIVNQTIQINNVPFTVIGIMAPGFQDPIADQIYEHAELWTPLGYDPTASFACRTCRHLNVFARVKSGTSRATAQAELTGIITAAAAAHPKEYDRPGVGLTRLDDLLLGPVRPVLLILAGGVLLLLLVACGNVANLLLIRASEREQELAVRTALGVTGARLARQLLTEALVLALIGVVAGLPLAAVAIQFIVKAAPADLPRVANASLDVRAAAVAIALTIATGLVFGILPALQARRRRVFSGLRDGARRTATGATWRLRALLVAGNVTMATVLLVSSGLVAKSLFGLLAVDVGFSPSHVLTAQLSVAGPRFSTGDTATQIQQASTFYDDLMTRLRAHPAVKSAAAVTTLPLGGSIDGFGLQIVGRPLENPESAPGADRFVVTPGFFDVVGIKLLRGRLLDATDRQGAQRVAVVNATLARELFPGEEALGHAVQLGGPDTPGRTIVGVVADVLHRGLDAAPGYQIYVPQSQWAWAETELTIVARTDGDAAGLAAPLRAIVRDFDAAQPLTNVRTYDDVITMATGPRRLAAQLLTAFAVVALLLAVVGLSGALGVVARQRRQEIGLRLALGADRAQIGRLLLLQGLRPSIAGLITGLLIVALADGVLQSLLYGINGLDRATFTWSALVMLLAAACACAVPARRASRLDAAGVLRGE